MAKKRSGQWFGDSELQTVQAGATVATVIQLLPTVSSLQSMRDVVFERCIISFQTRRNSLGFPDGYAFIVWKGNVLSGTSTPVEALDPLSQSTFSWSHSSIMKFGPLRCPPILLNGFDGVSEISGELTAEQVEIVVKRKVSRANEGIFLKVSTDASNLVKCNITFRTYYTYAA